MRYRACRCVLSLLLSAMERWRPSPTLFPYTTLFRSREGRPHRAVELSRLSAAAHGGGARRRGASPALGIPAVRGRRDGDTLGRAGARQRHFRRNGSAHPPSAGGRSAQEPGEGKLMPAANGARTSMRAVTAGIGYLSPLAQLNSTTRSLARSRPPAAASR